MQLVFFTVFPLKGTIFVCCVLDWLGFAALWPLVGRAVSRVCIEFIYLGQYQVTLSNFHAFIFQYEGTGPEWASEQVEGDIN